MSDWLLRWSPIRTLTTLYQTEVWTGDGRRYLIDNMTPSHAENVVAGLDRQAAWLASQVTGALIVELRAIESGKPPAIGSGRAELEVWCAAAAGPHTVWLHSTPLYRRLDELAASARVKLLQDDPWAATA